MSSRLWLLLLAVCMVSTAGLFAQRALDEATPLEIAAWRLGLAALLFLCLSVFKRPGAAPASASPTTSLRLILAGACLALHFLTWFTALAHASVARATLLACTTPLWTMVCNFVLGRERITGRRVFALGLGLLGIALVGGAQVGNLPRTSLVSDLLALSAGLFFALYLLAVENLHQTVPAQRQVTWTYTVAGVLLWAALLCVPGGIRLHYSAGVWTALAGMTLGPQVLGHTLLNWSLRHFSSSVVAFAILLEPVIAGYLAWVLLGQRILPLQMVGGLLVLSALALVVGQQTPQEQGEDQPVG